MSEGPSTDRRVVVRVLLRQAKQQGEPAMVRRVGDYVAYVAGDAEARRWPGVELSVGDVEAMVWTTARQASAVVRNLSRCVGVVEARSDDGSGEGVPLGRLR